MSNMIGVEPVVDETPTVCLRPNPSAGEAPEGLGPNPSVGEEPSMDTDVASDGSEEGELQDDPPVSKKRKRSPSIEEQPPPKRVESGPEPTIDSFGDITCW